MKKRFNAYIRSLEFCNSNISELIALLRYKNISILKANEIRAFCDIDMCIETLQTLKESLQKEITQK